MTYYDKYHCIGCPVSKWCGTAVAATRLCHSLDDSIAEKEDNFKENLLCLAAGLFLAICLVALICGYGDKGLLDLF